MKRTSAGKIPGTYFFKKNKMTEKSYIDSFLIRPPFMSNIFLFSSSGVIPTKNSILVKLSNEGKNVENEREGT